MHVLHLQCFSLTNLFRNFTLPVRDMGAWDICKSDITEQAVLLSGKEITGHLNSLTHCPGGIKCLGVTVIQTSFDHTHRNNVRFPAKKDRKENIVWTEGERLKAAAGEVIRDLDDLRNKVHDS